MDKSSKEPVLLVEGVSKHFGGVTAVDNVSVKVFEGEIVGILGDNGAGKSTLIKMISGVYSPNSGKIYLEGKRIDGKSTKEVRDMGIETIYQDLAMADRLDASANVFLGKEVYKNRFFDTLNEKFMAEETIKTLGMLAIQLPNAKRAVGLLSGGQRQGVAITRSIYWGKKFIIMDEPTAALGVNESLKVLELIKQTIKNVKAMIIITHNVEHVIQVAHRAVIMRNSRIVSRINFSDYKDRTVDLHNDIVKGITGMVAA